MNIPLKIFLEQLGSWRRIQLAHFLHSQPTQLAQYTKLTPYEMKCLQQGPTRPTILKMHSILNYSKANTARHTGPAGRETWGFSSHHNIGIGSSYSPIEPLAAHKIKKMDLRCSHWYRTPHILHKMLPSCPAESWRCGTEKGDILHLFWFYNLIKPFWTAIRTHLQHFTERLIPDNLAFFLLHHYTIPTIVY